VRRSVLPLLLVAAIAFVAVGPCDVGGGGGDRSERVRVGEPPGRRAVEEPPAPQRRLEDALLTLDDLPEGWVVAPPEDNGLSRTYYEVCGEPDVYGGLRPVLAVSALFSDRGGTTFVSHELRRHDPGVAAEALERLEAALARCDIVTEHDDRGDTTSYTLALVDPPAVEEPAVRFRLARRDGATEWHAEVVVARRGDVLSMLAIHGRPVDQPRVVDLSDRVDERLAELA
jgi:hypothetical protein